MASALIYRWSEWVGCTATYFTYYQHTGHDLLYLPAKSEIDTECTCRCEREEMENLYVQVEEQQHTAAVVVDMKQNDTYEGVGGQICLSHTIGL